MEKTSLTYKTLKNVSYSSVGYGWSMVFAIFITPIIVFKLGVIDYGIYIFINTIAGMMGLSDLGISSAVAKYTSEYSGAKNEERLKKLLYSANSLFLIMGLFGLSCLIIIGIAGKYLISSPAILAYNLPVLFFLVGLIFFINAISGVYTIAPVALQRFDISTKIGVTQNTLSSISILIVVLLGFKLQTIFLTQFIILIIFIFIYKHYSQKIMRIAKLKFLWDKTEIIKCYKFGLVASISNISGQALSYFDKLIIPIFMNPAALSYYSLSGSVASKSTSIINTLTGILLPMTSSLQGENDKKNIDKLYIRSLRLTTILSAAISFSISFFAYKIMLYWMDKDIAENTYKILIILAPTYFILSIFTPMTNFLLGLGETKTLAIFSALMAFINIILLFILLPKFGITGAAIAYLISVLPIIYLIFYTEKKILNLNDRFLYHLKIYSKLFFTGIIFYFISKILIDPIITSFKTLLIFGPLSIIIFLSIYKLFGFYEKEDWDSLKSFLFICIKKFKKI